MIFFIKHDPIQSDGWVMGICATPKPRWAPKKSVIPLVPLPSWTSRRSMLDANNMRTNPCVICQPGCHLGYRYTKYSFLDFVCIILVGQVSDKSISPDCTTTDKKTLTNKAVIMLLLNNRIRKLSMTSKIEREISAHSPRQTKVSETENISSKCSWQHFVGRIRKTIDFFGLSWGSEKGTHDCAHFK